MNTKQGGGNERGDERELKEGDKSKSEQSEK